MTLELEAKCLRCGERSSDEGEPTVVLFIEGGAVQGIEGNATVRVILCDFDSEDGPQVAGERPCHIGVWDHPEEPSKEFREVLEIAGRDKKAHQQQVE